MTHAIEVDNITRTYGSFAAVDKLSFSVDSGEVYGLLGTNGAGKTSALEILEGLAAPTDGQVKILDTDPLTARPHMGIMLQQGGLPSGLTVFETVRMWAGTCSHPLDPEVVIEQVGVSHRSDVKVGALSGGEQRRVDLACALVGNPQILFLDEPTTGLDPESRRGVWELLKELKSQGVTMVLTTHYLEEAEYLCDRLCIMHQGRIHVEGSISEIVDSAFSEISFSAEVPVREIPVGHAQAQDGAITIATKDLAADTRTVLNWAHDKDIQLENFSAHAASLEQVFLSVASESTATSPVNA